MLHGGCRERRRGEEGGTRPGGDRRNKSGHPEENGRGYPIRERRDTRQMEEEGNNASEGGRCDGKPLPQGKAVEKHVQGAHLGGRSNDSERT